MKRLPFFALLPFSALLVLAITGFIQPQNDARIESAQLKSLIEGLGYPTKTLNAEPGKEKYEFVVTRGGLDTPIAAEVSASKNIVWLTVYLGDVADGLPSAKATEMLKENAKIQPCHFYITASNRLMLGFGMENRGITAAIVRRWAEKLADDVAKTEELWGK